MSLTTRMCPAYSLTCEQPGCDRRLADEGRVMWLDPDVLELDALRADWQHDEDDRWYCPKHWHLTCHYCGQTAVGDPDRLADAGWEAGFWTGYTCPDCAAKRQKE